jgi:hypothetical protein
MQDITQYASWYDINDSDILPTQVSEWENYMDTKEFIDDIFNQINNQIIKFENIGFNYLTQLESLNINEELKPYVYDKYQLSLLNIAEYFAIPSLDDVIQLPTECEKTFTILYNHFFATQVEDLIFYLISNDFEKNFIHSNFRECKQTVINYYNKMIKSFTRLLELVNVRGKEIAAKIDEYGYVKEVIRATDKESVSAFFMNLIDAFE